MCLPGCNTKTDFGRYGDSSRSRQKMLRFSLYHKENKLIIYFLLNYLLIIFRITYRDTTTSSPESQIFQLNGVAKCQYRKINLSLNNHALYRLISLGHTSDYKWLWIIVAPLSDKLKKHSLSSSEGIDMIYSICKATCDNSIVVFLDCSTYFSIIVL